MDIREFTKGGYFIPAESILFKDKNGEDQDLIEYIEELEDRIDKQHNMIIDINKNIAKLCLMLVIIFIIIFYIILW